jgi:hypothetical protein
MATVIVTLNSHRSARATFRRCPPGTTWTDRLAADVLEGSVELSNLQGGGKIASGLRAEWHWGKLAVR